MKSETYSAECWRDWESYFRKEVVALCPVKGGSQLFIVHITMEFYDCTFFTRHTTIKTHRPYACHSQRYIKRTDAHQVSSKSMKVHVET